MIRFRPVTPSGIPGRSGPSPPAPTGEGRARTARRGDNSRAKRTTRPMAAIANRAILLFTGRPGNTG